MLALNSQRAASRVLRLKFVAQPDLISFSYPFTGGCALVSVLGPLELHLQAFANHYRFCCRFWEANQFFTRTLNTESSPTPKSPDCSFTFGVVIQSAVYSGDCGPQLCPSGYDPAVCPVACGSAVFLQTLLCHGLSPPDAGVTALSLSNVLRNSGLY